MAGFAAHAKRWRVGWSFLGDRWGTAIVWVAGSAIVAAAQPSLDRRVAAAGAAAAGIAVLLVVARLTEDGGRRYIRSLLGAIVAVSVTAMWLLRGLLGVQPTFLVNGLEQRIAIPLIFVLAAPLVLRALPPRLRGRSAWSELRALAPRARPLDWILAVYVALSLPALVLGVAHHAPKTYIAQDLGLVVFFALMYVAGRAVEVRAARASAMEMVDVLLLLTVAQFVMFGWTPAPLYSYSEAACVGAVAFALLRPRSGGFRFLSVGIGVTVLVSDAAAVANGTNSSTAIALAGALAVLGFLVVRMRRLVPLWLVGAAAIAALVVFVGFTSDGATVRGQYHGANNSNAGRTYEAQQVRTEVGRSPVSLILGRGFGGTIDESHAPLHFRNSLLSAGRDLSQVPEVHLLDYEFLLKYGFAGIAWLAAFAVALAWAVFRGLERSAVARDGSLVIYAALPLLGLAEALAAASHLQDNPLNAFALGVVVTCLSAQPRT